MPYVSVLGTVFRRGRGSFISCGTQFLSSISTLALKKKTQRGTSAKSTEEISDLERGLRTQSLRMPLTRHCQTYPASHPNCTFISPPMNVLLPPYFPTHTSTPRLFSGHLCVQNQLMTNTRLCSELSQIDLARGVPSTYTLNTT